jgi:hypothetical protein
VRERPAAASRSAGPTQVLLWQRQHPAAARYPRPSASVRMPSHTSRNLGQQAGGIQIKGGGRRGGGQQRLAKVSASQVGASLRLSSGLEGEVVLAVPKRACGHSAPAAQ